MPNIFEYLSKNSDIADAVGINSLMISSGLQRKSEFYHDRTQTFSDVFLNCCCCGKYQVNSLLEPSDLWMYIENIPIS